MEDSIGLCSDRLWPVQVAGRAQWGRVSGPRFWLSAASVLPPAGPLGL